MTTRVHRNGKPLPGMAAVLSFVDCINMGDLDRLTSLMTKDHSLRVLDQPAIVGVEANWAAWNGYFTAYPEYVIYPHRMAQVGALVALVGHTTGSHLGLPDEEESKLRVIWMAETREGKLASWVIAEDTPEFREKCGLDRV